jgi:antirestriction protein
MAELRSSDEQPHQVPEVDAATVERRRSSLTPRIYVASLSDYNAGELRGVWIDADQDEEDLQAAVRGMLATSNNQPAEDWAIHDYEGFGSFQLSEHQSLAVVSAVALGIAEYDGAFAAYAAWAGTDEETLGAFNDCYLGRWPSLDAFARDTADDFGWEAALQGLPEAMRDYVSIDYPQFAHFLESTLNIVEADGGIYVFTER